MDRALAICDRAVVFAEEGKYEVAIAELQKAIQVERTCYLAYYNLAWIHATCPEAQFRDGAQAIREATTVIDLQQHFHQIGVKDRRAQWMGPACLAAAYAESGEYDKSITAMDDALQCVQYVPGEDQGIRMRELVESRLRAALKLYRAGKPLRAHKTALSKLSDEWADAILGADDSKRFPELAE